MNNKSTDIDITSLSNLAKITLSSEQANRIKSDLVQFTEFAQILSDFEADGLSPSEHNDFFREDNAVKSTYTAEALSSPSRISNGYISVPLTVEENEE